MRFRRRAGFSRKKFREPTNWDRVKMIGQSGTSIFTGAGTAIIVWDPTQLISGGQDLRVTMRRLMIDGACAFTVTGGAVGNPIVVSAGIYIAGAGEPFRNPSLTALADERTDWLWLGHSNFFQNVASPATAAFTQLRNIQNQPLLIDLKANRKLDQDQVIYMTFDVPAQFAVSAATITHQFYSSVLWQRTSR